MTASASNIGYGSQLARQSTNLTTIALAITANASPQVVTPASMTSIVVGTLLAIDTASTTVKEVVEVTAKTGTTFTAIFRNSHGTSISIALMIPVVELSSLTPPGIMATPVEATHLMSDFTHREWIAGLPEGGEIGFQGNYILPANDATEAALLSDSQARTKSTWCAALGGTPGQDNECIWMFDGYVTEIYPGSITPDAIFKFSGKIKVTGKSFLYG